MKEEFRSVEPAQLHAELSALKRAGYNVLVDMTAVDYSDLGRAPRFELVYRLMKLDALTGLDLARAAVHVGLAENEPILRSARDLWAAADWLEREIWDMFGIPVADRPDMKRILLYDSFVGHPLRKDYPIAKRQPLIGPASGEPENNPSFNTVSPTIKYE